MLALIRKDLLLHKTAFLGFMPVLLIYLAWYATEGDSPNVFITMACIFSALLPMIFIARDDKFQTGAFICSLPVTRRQVARARFAMSWATALVSILIALVLFSLFAPENGLAIWNTSTAGRVLLTLTLGLGVMLPFLLRFGWTGLIVALVAMQVLGIVMLLVVTSIWPTFHLGGVFSAVSSFIDTTHARLGSALFLTAVVGVLIVCNLVSLRIATAMFERKEL